MTRSTVAWLIGVIAALICAGTVFFRLVEGWSWLDAYFFTVVTLSTVGYGSLVPATALGKIAATVLIFFGLAIFAVAVQRLGQFALTNRAAARQAVMEARALARQDEAEAEREAEAEARAEAEAQAEPQDETVKDTR